MTLSQAREAIDRLDREIVKLMADRLAVVDGISDYKATHNLPVHDPAREAQVIARLTAECADGFQEDIATLYQRLFEISRQRQERRRAAASPPRIDQDSR
ncbi:MAG: chorismate mutase [Eubacteriales bacterium]|nr:chorismate mutase [Eubacteriales bacterium]